MNEELNAVSQLIMRLEDLVPGSLVSFSVSDRGELVVLFDWPGDALHYRYLFSGDDLRLSKVDLVDMVVVRANHAHSARVVK